MTYTGECRGGPWSGKLLAHYATTKVIIGFDWRDGGMYT